MYTAIHAVVSPHSSHPRPFQVRPVDRGAARLRSAGATKFERKSFRTNILPITFGWPFGLSVLAPVNVPLPAKIVTEVLPPINIAAEFGDAPDIEHLDGLVRGLMQKGLDNPAAKRRFPILG